MKVDHLLIALFCALASSSPVSTNKNANLTATIGPVCVDSTLWSLPTFDANDCQRALQSFLDGDVATWGREVFDFLVAGATSRTQFRKVQLPAAYDYGSQRRLPFRWRCGVVQVSARG